MANSKYELLGYVYSEQFGNFGCGMKYNLALYLRAFFYSQRPIFKCFNGIVRFPGGSLIAKFGMNLTQCPSYNFNAFGVGVFMGCCNYIECLFF